MIKLLRRIFIHDFWLKLLALASAFLLWTAVAREPSVEVAHAVPIEFAHVPDNVVIRSETVPEAQVWIRGPQRVVREVRPNDLHLTIEVGAMTNLVGEHQFELTPQQIRAPRGVEIVQVTPSMLRLAFVQR